jgi:hypothetical protein
VIRVAFVSDRQHIARGIYLMSKMLQLVEQMHVRLNEIAASEQALLKALRDALNRVDDKLMQDVRTITAEHETKRRAVLDELQSLASRIGAFPMGREAVPELGYVEPGSWPPEGERKSHPPAHRRPTSNSITDELNHYFRVRASSH